MTDRPFALAADAGSPLCVAVFALLALALAVVVAHAVHMSRRLNDERRARRSLEDETQRLRSQIESNRQLTTVLMGNMAHELRTPLNSILGYSRLIARDARVPDAHRQQLNIINRNGGHLLDLINNILDYSKIEAGQTGLNMVAFDLCRCLDDVSLLVIDNAHSKRLRFNPMIDRSVRGLWVLGDQDKLRQVLLNLLTNAIKYTQAHHVTLGARAEPAADAGLVLHLDVEDSGPGIPADKLATIFLPFERLVPTAGGPTGTGLGLAITKSLVELMNGTITVVNTDAGGSRFSVALPVTVVPVSVPADDRAGRLVAHRLSAGQPECRVLVVDDDTDSRELLRSFLTELGFAVRGAADGAQALATFSAWHPRFVWMDLQLPDMNGRDVARVMRGLEGGAQVKIAALTAHAFRDQCSDFLEAGFDEFLLKPYRDDEIIATMQRQLQVAFDYSSAAAPAKVYVHLGADDLRNVPPGLIDRMLVTVGQSHNQHMHELIDLLPDRHGAVAHQLRLLVDTCEWGQLEQLLEEAAGRQPQAAQGLIRPS